MQVRLTLIAPQLFANGVNLPEGAIQSYSLVASITRPGSPPGPVAFSPGILPGNVTEATLTVSDAYPGDTLTVTAYANTETRQSDPSVSASLLLPEERPLPPTGLTLSPV